MFIFSNFNGGRGRVSTGGGIGCLIMGVLGLVVAYYILKGVFTVLWWAAPVLFIATLFINWRVVADAGRALINLFRTRPLAGVVVAVLGVVAFPLLAFFLFLSALGSQRLKGVRDEFERQGGFGKMPAETPVEGEFIDFEELESRPNTIPEQPLEPPKAPEKETRRSPENPYEDLFKP